MLTSHLVIIGMQLRAQDEEESDHEQSEEDVPDPGLAGERVLHITLLTCHSPAPYHRCPGFEMDLKAFTALAQRCGLFSGGRKETAPLLQRADVDIMFRVRIVGSLSTCTLQKQGGGAS